MSGEIKVDELFGNGPSEQLQLELKRRKRVSNGESEELDRILEHADALYDAYAEHATEREDHSDLGGASHVLQLEADEALAALMTSKSSRHAHDRARHLDSVETHVRRLGYLFRALSPRPHAEDSELDTGMLTAIFLAQKLDLPTAAACRIAATHLAARANTPRGARWLQSKAKAFEKRVQRQRWRLSK